MSFEQLIGIIIFMIVGVFYIYIDNRNLWVLNKKLEVFERAVHKRKRLELYGKEGLLLKDIENGMWSYNKMLFTFWESDVSKMFHNKYIKRYIYEDKYEISDDD